MLPDPRSKILGIDYGRRRLGLAIADATIKVATPKSVLQCKNPRAEIPTIKQIVTEEQITLVVVGLPLDQDGKTGMMAKEVKNWCKSLRKALNIPVELCDERFSSLNADVVGDIVGAANDMRDAMAAQAILDHYLQLQ